MNNNSIIIKNLSSSINGCLFLREVSFDIKPGEILPKSSDHSREIFYLIDQAAGIVFNLKENGDYLTIRANPLENNLVLWKYIKGKRSSEKWIRNVPTPSKQWHSLKVEFSGSHIKGFLSDKLYLKHDWKEPIKGKVGLWSKADSLVYFDDYQVQHQKYTRSPL